MTLFCVLTYLFLKALFTGHGHLILARFGWLGQCGVFRLQK